MAHYAYIGADNIVQRVIVVDDAWEAGGEDQGVANIISWGGVPLAAGCYWKKTSYNGKIRGKFAGAGDIYDPEMDAFVAPGSPA